MLVPVRRALLSVSDKTGLVEFARQLAARNIELLSTGGTAKLLAEGGVAVREVSDYTGFPEIMGGRVKTLHPRIHGGLLGRRGVDDAVMKKHDIPRIDLLVVNLYPFAATIARGVLGTRASGDPRSGGALPHRHARRAGASGWVRSRRGSGGGRWHPRASSTARARISSGWAACSSTTSRGSPRRHRSSAAPSTG